MSGSLFEFGVGGSFVLKLLFFWWGWFFLKVFFLYFSLFCGRTLLIIVQHSLIQSHNFFSCIWGNVSVGRCAFLVFGQQQLNNCFWKIWVALRRAGWCDLVQANLLIWADFAGWTGWEVLTFPDEWNMALVMVLVEVERVEMVVMGRSAGTVVHWESLQRDWIIQKCCVDFPPVVQLKVS